MLKLFCVLIRLLWHLRIFSHTIVEFSFFFTFGFHGKIRNRRDTRAWCAKQRAVMRSAFPQNILFGPVSDWQPVL